jgi:hypothetical protein
VLRAGADVILRERFSERGAQFLGLHNWVDDLLQLAVLNGLDPTAATTISRDYYADAGVVLADEKGRDWSSVVLFQGLEWNLRLKIVSLPESKRLRALDKLSAFRSSPWVTKDAIESICGYLSHISFVVEEGRFHLVSLFKEKARFMKNPFLKLPLPIVVLADVDWWTARLEAGAPSVDSDSPSISRRLTVPPTLYPSIISSDASDIGIGIVVEGRQAFWPLVANWRQDGTNIDVPEAIAVELALRAVFCLRPNTSGVVIRAQTDNQTVWKAWLARRSRSPRLNAILEQIHLLATVHDCQLDLQWVPSELNAADAVSRGEEPFPELDVDWRREPPSKKTMDIVVYSEHSMGTLL